MPTKPQLFKDALTFVTAHPLGTLATVDERGKPWCSALYFLFEVDAKPMLYFLTRSGTRKYDHMMKHPDVSVVFIDEVEVRTLQMSGKASVVKGARDQRAYFETMNNIIHERINGWAPIHKMEGGHVEVLSIEVEYMREFNFLTPNEPESRVWPPDAT